MKRGGDMIRTLGLCAAIVLLTAFLGIIALTVSLFGSPERTIHRIAQIWGALILSMGRIRVQVKGLSRIDPNRSYIFMANHQSNFDIPVLLAHLKVQFRWLAKAELFKIPIFGRAMRKAGYISIDRSDRKSAFLSLKKAAETIRRGTSVLIFPEGTRSLDGRIRPFKKGGFVLATEAGVPVVPVVLRGTWSIMAKDGWTIRPGDVTLQVLRPVPTRDFNRKAKDLLLKKIRHIMKNAFESDLGGNAACSN